MKVIKLNVCFDVILQHDGASLSVSHQYEGILLIIHSIKIQCTSQAATIFIEVPWILIFKECKTVL